MYSYKKYKSQIRKSILIRIVRSIFYSFNIHIFSFSSFRNTRRVGVFKSMAIDLRKYYKEGFLNNKHISDGDKKKYFRIIKARINGITRLDTLIFFIDQLLAIIKFFVICVSLVLVPLLYFYQIKLQGIFVGSYTFRFLLFFYIILVLTIPEAITKFILYYYPYSKRRSLFFSPQLLRFTHRIENYIKKISVFLLFALIGFYLYFFQWLKEHPQFLFFSGVLLCVTIITGIRLLFDLIAVYIRLLFHKVKQHQLTESFITSMFIVLGNAFELDNENELFKKQSINHMLDLIALSFEKHLFQRLAASDVPSNDQLKKKLGLIAAGVRGYKIKVSLSDLNTHKEIHQQINNDFISYVSYNWEAMHKEKIIDIATQKTLNKFVLFLRSIIISGLPLIIVLVIQNYVRQLKSDKYEFALLVSGLWFIFSMINYIDPDFGKKVSAFKEIKDAFIK